MQFFQAITLILLNCPSCPVPMRQNYYTNSFRLTEITAKCSPLHLNDHIVRVSWSDPSAYHWFVLHSTNENKAGVGNPLTTMKPLDSPTVKIDLNDAMSIGLRY